MLFNIYMSQLILSDNIPHHLIFEWRKKFFPEIFGDINNSSQFIMFVF